LYWRLVHREQESDSMTPPRGTGSRRRFLGSAAAFALALVATPLRAEQDDGATDTPLPPDTTVPSQAEEFVSSIANSILAVARSSLAPNDKKLQFQTLLEAYADIPTIAVFSLGRYAGLLTEDRRESYYSLVSGYISRIFVTHSANLGGRDVNVTGSIARSERETLVESTVWFESGKSLPVIWRVIATDVGFKVFDVGVNGIWLAIQQRSEFVSIIRRNDGDIEALVAFLTRNN
jgi:phospholipid transport system substrate-binding protein